MNTRPVLVCQGFQRAFIQADGPMFSVSASVRRSVCEQVLKRARTSGWTVVHSFLDTDTLGATGGASIDGFAPSPAEPYFRQRTLSAFRNPGFQAKLESVADRPVYLISLAGLSVIAATFFDGLERRLPIRIITDAVADTSHSGVDERERLEAIEVLARAHGRDVTSHDLGSMSGLPARPSTRSQLFLDGVL
jgi:nicotinamidase-related amidase